MNHYAQNKNSFSQSSSHHHLSQLESRLETIHTRGPVVIIGSGLLGASLGLRLRGSGVDVYLDDISPTNLELAIDIGAGKALPSSQTSRQASECDERDVRLVICAVPPDVAADVIVRSLEKYPCAVVTDVASVKSRIERDVYCLLQQSHRSSDMSRYIGSHPMAGKEKSGAGRADADLFEARPWVVVTHNDTKASTQQAIRGLAFDVGALPIELDSASHDRAVALISHVPQIVSSLLAAQLIKASDQALSLSGQGLRDTTRIAHSDPRLWTAIIDGNRQEIATILHTLAHDIEEVAATCDEEKTVEPIFHAIWRGNEGVNRIPGKHGGAPRHYAHIDVLVPDTPGSLGKLFSDAGCIGINIEDLGLEHSRYGAHGIASLSVEPRLMTSLIEGLHQRGWKIINWDNSR